MPGTVLRTSIIFYINSFNPCNPKGLVLVLVPLDLEETEAWKDQMHLACLTESALPELLDPQSADDLKDRHCTARRIFPLPSRGMFDRVFGFFFLRL